MEAFLRKNQLLVATISAILVGLAVYSLVHPKPNPVPSTAALPATLPPAESRPPFVPPTDEATPSFGDNPSPPNEVNTNIVLTPSPYPVPSPGATGTNLPDSFSVEKWRDDNIVCDRNQSHKTVKVTGVIIFNGTSPYQFNLWRYYTKTTLTIVAPTLIYPEPNNLGEELVVFDPPIELKKGEYYHVTISFKWSKGSAVWVDDLFYPLTEFDSRCQ